MCLYLCILYLIYVLGLFSSIIIITIIALQHLHVHHPSITLSPFPSPISDETYQTSTIKYTQTHVSCCIFLPIRTHFKYLLLSICYYLARRRTLLATFSSLLTVAVSCILSLPLTLPLPRGHPIYINIWIYPALYTPCTSTTLSTVSGNIRY
jgi:hypothetical protein